MTPPALPRIQATTLEWTISDPIEPTPLMLAPLRDMGIEQELRLWCSAVLHLKAAGTLYRALADDAQFSRVDRVLADVERAMQRAVGARVLRLAIQSWRVPIVPIPTAAADEIAFLGYAYLALDALRHGYERAHGLEERTTRLLSGALSRLAQAAHAGLPADVALDLLNLAHHLVVSAPWPAPDAAPDPVTSV